MLFNPCFLGNLQNYFEFSWCSGSGWGSEELMSQSCSLCSISKWSFVNESLDHTQGPTRVYFPFSRLCFTDPQITQKTNFFPKNCQKQKNYGMNRISLHFQFQMLLVMYRTTIDFLCYSCFISRLFFKIL